ncbi:MAG TPA: NUDIX domain-containing protein [Ilumatobacteraceae bacterium]|jgi:putative (di)nucleoside polyphosphate hydrolase
MPSVNFRAGVVIVVRGLDDRILAFERGDVPGQWQFPQGGMEPDEAPLAAAWRELGEETGLGPDDVMAVAEYPDWVVYEYPPELKNIKGRLGQAHRWFLFDATHADVTPRPDGREFVRWQWVTREWMLEHVVDFRRPGYARVLQSM